jgi:hypothetical protein
MQSSTNTKRKALHHFGDLLHNSQVFWIADCGFGIADLGFTIGTLQFLILIIDIA